MAENLTVYEQAVTTDRPAEMLARRHGFKNLEQLANSLPEGAQILDVGSGASPFGREVAKRRPDITWVNFDYSYQDPSILEEVSEDKPDNLTYVAGDATKLTDYFEPEQFDGVFSYWLMPHLSIDDKEPALKVAKGIFEVADKGAYISVGPKKQRFPSPLGGKAVQVIKSRKLDEESYADRIVEETMLSPLSRKVQKASNEVATPYFGTSRYAKGRGLRMKVYHPKSGEYLSQFHPNTIYTLGKLALKLTAHMIGIKGRDKELTGPVH
jgi:ubiquinone/menaquinone biosynthesis C-methylase UbiE